MTIAALLFIRTSAKESNGAGAAAVWLCGVVPPPRAATAAMVSATVAMASTKIPAVRMVFSSLCCVSSIITMYLMLDGSPGSKLWHHCAWKSCSQEHILVHQRSWNLYHIWRHNREDTMPKFGHRAHFVAQRWQVRGRL